jgi:hypothetical protein
MLVRTRFDDSSSVSGIESVYFNWWRELQDRCVLIQFQSRDFVCLFQYYFRLLEILERKLN